MANSRAETAARRRRAGWRLIAPLWLGLLVSSCATSSPPSVAPDAVVGKPVSAPPALFSPPSSVPAIGALAGMEPREILALLGAPDLQREEPPAEIWQYRAPDCVLDLFFYRQGDALRLVHAETRDRRLGVGITPRRCHDDAAPLRAHLQSRL